MKKILVSVVDSLYYLVFGEQDDEPAFKQKLGIVLAWLLVILFCWFMLKMFIRP
jgi:hypothetical protein